MRRTAAILCYARASQVPRQGSIPVPSDKGVIARLGAQFCIGEVEGDRRADGIRGGGRIDSEAAAHGCIVGVALLIAENGNGRAVQGAMSIGVDGHAAITAEVNEVDLGGGVSHVLRLNDFAVVSEEGSGGISGQYDVCAEGDRERIERRSAGAADGLLSGAVECNGCCAGGKCAVVCPIARCVDVLIICVQGSAAIDCSIEVDSCRAE